MCPELNSDSVLMSITIIFSLSEFSSINLCASYASMFFIVVFVVVVCTGVSGVFVAVDVFVIFLFEDAFAAVSSLLLFELFIGLWLVVLFIASFIVVLLIEVVILAVVLVVLIAILSVLFVLLLICSVVFELLMIVLLSAVSGIFLFLSSVFMHPLIKTIPVIAKTTKAKTPIPIKFFCFTYPFNKTE